jgi:hypothetical protein
MKTEKLETETDCFRRIATLLPSRDTVLRRRRPTRPCSTRLRRRLLSRRIVAVLLLGTFPTVDWNWLEKLIA